MAVLATIRGRLSASLAPTVAPLPLHSGPVLDINNLVVSAGTTHLVEGVSLSVNAGETLCLVGESGCGKSLTCMSALGLLDEGLKASGSVKLFGTETVGAPDSVLNRLRGNRIAMIFQNPMSALNPIRRVGSQIVEAIKQHTALRGQAAEQRMEALLDQVGIPDIKRSKKSYPHQLSGGMCQRVMIAMALACRPQLLIADEPTTALDVTIQAQILRLIQALQKELDLAVVFVTHDLGVVAEIADRVAVMYAGRVVETGSAEALFTRPAHPYTRALMNSRIGFAREPGTPLESIGGTVPAPTARPAGCAFAPRCTLAQDICSTRPVLAPAGSTLAACHLAQQHIGRSA